MTFEEVIKRALFRWWLIAIFVIVFTLAFLNWTTTDSYQASIGLGISFNNESFVEQSGNQTISAIPGQTKISAGEYAYSLAEFSSYLTARFSSIEVQSKIAEKVGVPQASYSSKQPFYTVETQNGGYISVDYSAKDQPTAELFLKVVKEEFRNLILVERNKKEVSAFQIDPKNEFVENITQIARPNQFKILPSLAGFLIGLTVAILLPFKKF